MRLFVIKCFQGTYVVQADNAMGAMSKFQSNFFENSFEDEFSIAPVDGYMLRKEDAEVQVSTGGGFTVTTTKPIIPSSVLNQLESLLATVHNLRVDLANGVQGQEMVDLAYHAENLVHRIIKP